MRILLLSPYFFPYLNPRAHRWTAIAKEWAQQGWEVHVVCSLHRDWPAEGDWEGIQVHRTGFNSVKEWVYFHFQKVPQRGEALHQKPSNLPRLLNDWLLKSWYWPDDAWTWIPGAKKKARQLLDQGHWDALISVSLPFSAHWVARKLKRRFPHIHWIADIGDPFSLQTQHPLNNEYLYRRKNFRAERQILGMADHVVVTNEGLANAYRERFPGLHTPVQVIPPMASSTPPIHIPWKNPARPLQFGYFGSFFRHIRQPEPMLRFFERLLPFQTSWELHIYGPVFEEFWPVFDHFPHLKPHLGFHGILPRNEVMSKMKEMDVLVMLGNTTSFQLPSKWADYLVAGRPILHLLQTSLDPALSMIEGKEYVRSIPWNEVALQARLWDFLEQARDWEIKDGVVEKWKECFSAKAIAGAYEILIQKIKPSPASGT
ncbi:MAG: glycosyltransferase [Saprospirales bacterium]|nr:glycosyltransferase [Saprospirales bacterium]